MEKIKFSIIIPVKEINDYLKESIPRILDLNYKDYEIIILPNEKPKKIPFYLKHRKIRIVPTGKVSPAIKRDIAAEKSMGEYLAFIDDDAYPQKDWLSIAEKIFEHKKADNVAAIGGPAITPKNDSIIQKSSGLFFETIFGGGGLSYRYKPAKHSFYVVDFPSVNLIVSRKAFINVGGFESQFWPGEDTKFCLDFIKKGYKIWYSNKLIVYHHRRDSIIGHLKQIGNYGRHRGYFAKRYPETSRKLIYFMPSLFLFGNIFLLLSSIFFPLIFKVWVGLLAFYFILIIADIMFRTLNPVIILITTILTFFSHIVYGARFISGLFSKEFKSQLR